ncbi:MAG: PepSY domain-containing protein, partial [Xanthomonadales bacterium]|nr:PepSY domain-containing protein [Xanthomonadales bacterium]
YPGAQFSGLYLPDEEEPYFTVRLLSQDEPAQKFGVTAVLVSAQSGAVLNQQSAGSYPLARRLVNSLYPLHTLQLAGWPGRILSLLVGVWLLTMMALGISLYWKRRA